MAFLGKIKELLNGAEDDYEEQDEIYDIYDDFEDPRPSRRRAAASAYSDEGEDFVDSRPRQRIERDNKVVSIHTTAQLQVVIVKPVRFDEAADIADHLVEKRTVVLNLEQTSKDIARRIIDFLCGAAYAHNGRIKPIANNTYIITPFNVGLIGTDVLGELENNGVFF